MVRDQLWLVPYNQNEMSNLSLPSTLSFPLRDIDTNDEYILIQDNANVLWSFKNITQKNIEIKRALKDKVKTYKVWEDKVIVYAENNELLQVSLKSFESVPVKPGLCISVEQIACGKEH